MNRAQQIVVGVALILASCAVLFPPYVVATKGIFRGEWIGESSIHSPDKKWSTTRHCYGFLISGPFGETQPPAPPEPDTLFGMDRRFTGTLVDKQDASVALGKLGLELLAIGLLTVAGVLLAKRYAT